MSAARDQLLADALGRHRDLGKGAAGCRLKVASDLTDVAKVDPAGLFTADGLDDAKLTQTLAELHSRRPDLFEQPEWPGMGQGKQGSHFDGTNSFTKAFSPTRR